MSEMLEIIEEPAVPGSGHFKISIRFEGTSRLDIDELRNGRIVEVPVSPFVKDYDAKPDSGVEHLFGELDATNWIILAAFENNTRIGGAVIAIDTPGMHLLEGRSDLATMLDIRIATEARGSGIGTALFRAAEDWARKRGAEILTIETQDINVGACRFYHAMGCRVRRINAYAYEGLDEVQVIWEKRL